MRGKRKKEVMIEGDRDENKIIGTKMETKKGVGR